MLERVRCIVPQGRGGFCEGCIVDLDSLVYIGLLYDIICVEINEMCFIRECIIQIVERSI